MDKGITDRFDLRPTFRKPIKVLESGDILIMLREFALLGVRKRVQTYARVLIRQTMLLSFLQISELPATLRITRLALRIPSKRSRSITLDLAVALFLFFAFSS